MRYCISIASACLLWVGAAFAEIEEARDLMEEGKFVEARELLACGPLGQCRCRGTDWRYVRHGFGR